MLRFVALLLFAVLITGCSNQGYFAPVSLSHYFYRYSGQTQYIVKPHDTLYSIAFRYDTDFRTLAQINHIRSPYRLRVGQVIYLKPFRTQPLPAHRSAVMQTMHVQKHTAHRLAPVTRQKLALSSNRTWVWPVQGRILKTYAPEKNRKGIDIAGRRGDPVRSSASGIVAYAGSGLPGYGHLIIIKHDHDLLTAYSHNEKNLVREGQHVQAGQIIARIGMIDRAFYGLHYEIRRSGHPVNPMHFLK